MPHQTHSRSISWEQQQDGYPYYASSFSKSQVNLSSTPKLQGPQRRTAVVESASYLPLPYVKPRATSPSRKPTSRPTSIYSFPGTEPQQNRKLKPLPLSLLPSLPQPIRAHPRNELQRRNSPTGSGFGSFPPFSPASPSLSQAPAVQSVSGLKTQIDGIAVEDDKQEGTYTLTLRTTSTLEANASRLCLNTSPPFPPAQVTLFPSLPAAQFDQIRGHLELLANKVRAFRISTGQPTKKHNGQIVLSVAMGEREIRRLFVGLRTSWWTWLEDEDRAFQGVGWFLLDEKDQVEVEKINDASRIVNEAGEVKGWATGLCLWRKEGEVWKKTSEFGFASDGEL
jgi:hypothetical protein